MGWSVGRMTSFFAHGDNGGTDWDEKLISDHVSKVTNRSHAKIALSSCYACPMPLLFTMLPIGDGRKRHLCFVLGRLMEMILWKERTSKCIKVSKMIHQNFFLN